MSIAFKQFPMSKVRSTKDEVPAPGQDMVGFALDPLMTLASSWSQVYSLLSSVMSALALVREWPAGKLVEVAVGHKTCYHTAFSNFMTEDPAAPPCENFVFLLGVGKGGTSKPPVTCDLKGVRSISKITELTYDNPESLTQNMAVYGTTIDVGRNVKGLQISGRLITFTSDDSDAINFAIEVFISNQFNDSLKSFHIVCDSDGIDHLGTTADHLRTIIYTMVERPESYTFPSASPTVSRLFGLLDETEGFNQMLTLCKQTQALKESVREGNHVIN